MMQKQRDGVILSNAKDLAKSQREMLRFTQHDTKRL